VRPILPQGDGLAGFVSPAGGGTGVFFRRGAPGDQVGHEVGERRPGERERITVRVEKMG